MAGHSYTDRMILKSENCQYPFSSWSIQQADNNEDWATFTSGQNSDLYDVQFIDRETGYAVGKNGIMLKTIAGGTYWTERNSNTTLDINTIYLQNETQGFLGGNASYLRKLEDNTNQFSTRFWYDVIGAMLKIKTLARNDARSKLQFFRNPKRFL